MNFDKIVTQSRTHESTFRLSPRVTGGYLTDADIRLGQHFSMLWKACVQVGRVSKDVDVDVGPPVLTRRYTCVQIFAKYYDQMVYLDLHELDREVRGPNLQRQGPID